MEIVLKKKSKKAREMLYLLEKRAISFDGVLALGGDGTLLKAIHQYDFNPVFLGLNFGHRGSLSNKVFNDSLERIKNREFEIHHFPLLEVETDAGFKGLALEVYFKAVGPGACKAKIKVSGTLIAKRFVGDGVDIATALASSGYFVPLKGSAVHPKLPVICFAPMAPNAPFQIMPIIYPNSSVFEITLLSPVSEVRGWCDGIKKKKIDPFRKLTVRKADKVLKLAFWKGEDFNKRLVEKIMKIQEGKR